MSTTLKELERGSIFAWLLANQIKNESGEVLDFDRYRFMRAIYADRSRLLVCMKAAQIGFSTYEILKSAFECRNERMDIIYVLPSDDDVKRFSGGKTNKIIAQNPILQAWTKEKDSIYQKQFGANTVYYEGSWTERAALSTTAQKLIVDEYDRCKPEVVEQYDSRLQSIANPRKAFFSNPSIPDFGVHKFYQLSDQKKWHITHKCGKTYVMDEQCIDYDMGIYRCPECLGEISDEDRRMGQWIATSQGEWSGYWIPLWIAPWMPARLIAEAKRTKSPEFFANFVAGVPHFGSGDKVAAQTIINCLHPEANTQDGRIIIGVDTGLPIHIVCANKQGYFYYATLQDPKTGNDPYLELEKLLIRWPKSMVVADQGGDLIGIRKLQAKYPGRVFLCWYRKDRKSQEMITWGTGDKYGEVVADRNAIIQLFIDEMRERRVTFNGTESEWQEYIAHWLNIYRSWEENALGVKEFKWERTGPDHYAHATVYARIGLSKFAESMAKITDNGPALGIPTATFNNIAEDPRVVARYGPEAFDNLSTF